MSVLPKKMDSLVIVVTLKDLAKMNLIFMLDPERFDNDEIKVAYIISILYGSAMNWAVTLIEINDPCLNNY